MTQLSDPAHRRARKQHVIHSAIAQLQDEVRMYRNRLRETAEPLADATDPTDRYDGLAPELRDEVELMNTQLAAAEADLIRLQQADFQALYDQVVPGAVVHLSNGLQLVVGVNLRPFEVDGIAYRSVTEGAPLFPTLQGKRAGDSVSIHGADARVELVL